MDEGGMEGQETAWVDGPDEHGDGGAGGYWDERGQHHLPGYAGGEYDPTAGVYHPDGFDGTQQYHQVQQ